MPSHSHKIKVCNITKIPEGCSRGRGQTNRTACVTRPWRGCHYAFLHQRPWEPSTTLSCFPKSKLQKPHDPQRTSRHCRLCSKKWMDDKRTFLKMTSTFCMHCRMQQGEGGFAPSHQLFINSSNEKQQLLRRVGDKGYALVCNVPYDGDCFFSALVKAFHDQPDAVWTASNLRQVLVEFFHSEKSSENVPTNPLLAN